MGVRRTTGQHPGGIVVLPLGEEIYSFTPVQHPANDMTTDTVTTHFDYHSIDHNLLKLDILGHDDPTMIRMLQDLDGTRSGKGYSAGFDQEVMSLFQNTEALGITPEDIGGCQLGCAWHSGVWYGFCDADAYGYEAEVFFGSGADCRSGPRYGRMAGQCADADPGREGHDFRRRSVRRDDIMIYLIQKGLEEGLSFTIMESCAKGQGPEAGVGRGDEEARCAGLVYLVLQKDQVHVPEGPCGGLRYDGVACGVL